MGDSPNLAISWGTLWDDQTAANLIKGVKGENNGEIAEQKFNIIWLPSMKPPPPPPPGPGKVLGLEFNNFIIVLAVALVALMGLIIAICCYCMEKGCCDRGHDDSKI